MHSSGSVGENNGTIENADGRVNINNVGGSIGELRGNCAQNLGTITRCINSTVGTNSGTINPVKANFCSKCGTELTKKCSYYGAENDNIIVLNAALDMEDFFN